MISTKGLIKDLTNEYIILILNYAKDFPSYGLQNLEVFISVNKHLQFSTNIYLWTPKGVSEGSIKNISTAPGNSFSPK